MNVTDIGSGLCFFLLGMVVTLGGVWFTHVKNAVTRKDLEIMMKTIVADIGQLKVDVAVMKAAKGHHA